MVGVVLENELGDGIDLWQLALFEGDMHQFVGRGPQFFIGILFELLWKLLEQLREYVVFEFVDEFAELFGHCVFLFFWCG